MQTFEDAVDEVLRELKETLLKKQADYGHKNILEFGELGVLVRANDKLARLRNLMQSQQAALNEPLEDSWKDLAGYSVIALMLRRGTFTLPLGRKTK